MRNIPNPVSLSLLAAVVILGACSANFEGKTEIVDLRVIGVTAEPPEFVFYVPPEFLQMLFSAEEEPPPGDVERPPDGKGEGKGGGLLSETPPLKVDLGMLVVDSDGDPGEFSYKLTACVLTNNLECDPDLPSTELASGKSDTVETVVPVELPWEVVEASIAADAVGGIFGAAVWIRGEVSGEEGDETFLKSVIVTPDIIGGRVSNTNPQIVEILEGDKDEEQPLPAVLGEPVQLEVDQEYRLLPSIPEEARETYVVLSFDVNFDDLSEDMDPQQLIEDAQAEEITEELQVSFYSTCGTFLEDSKSEALNPIFETEEDKKEKSLSGRWYSPPEPEECSLWFVSDDGRGGVGWYQLDVSVK